MYAPRFGAFLDILKQYKTFIFVFIKTEIFKHKI